MVLFFLSKGKIQFGPNLACNSLAIGFLGSLITVSALVVEVVSNEEVPYEVVEMVVK
jgi:fluoride ion exporter CrcB/FEX